MQAQLCIILNLIFQYFIAMIANMGMFSVAQANAIGGAILPELEEELHMTLNEGALFGMLWILMTLSLSFFFTL